MKLEQICDQMDWQTSGNEKNYNKLISNTTNYTTNTIIHNRTIYITC